MTIPLSHAEVGEALAGFAYTAFRLELQRVYSVADEDGAVARFLAGDPPEPSELGGLQDWFDQIAQQTAAGKRVERVRVHDDPPTDYQRWERSMDTWNAEAGEKIYYLTRQRAHDVGLLPAAGDTDWWLLDSNRLIVMKFDDAGNWVGSELETDPRAVVRACAWRDLAVHYGRLGENAGAASAQHKENA